MPLRLALALLTVVALLAAGPGEAADASAKAAWRGLLQAEADKAGLPVDIADAVVAVESGYDPTRVGSVGEIGLMQVRPETAAMLGFKGTLAELATPGVNIHYGVTYLSQAWQQAHGDLCRALMKYKAGHGEERMTALSLTYCDRARRHLVALGSPYGGTAIPASVATAAPAGAVSSGSHRPRVRTAAISAAFWAAHDARVKAITARVERRWRVASSR